MILHQENLGYFIMLGSNNLFRDFCLMAFFLFFHFFSPHDGFSLINSVSFRLIFGPHVNATTTTVFPPRRCCRKAPNPWRWRRYKNTWYRDIGTWDAVARQQFGWRFQEFWLLHFRRVTPGRMLKVNMHIKQTNSGIHLRFDGFPDFRLMSVKTPAFNNSHTQVSHRPGSFSSIFLRNSTTSGLDPSLAA